MHGTARAFRTSLCRAMPSNTQVPLGSSRVDQQRVARCDGMGDQNIDPPKFGDGGIHAGLALLCIARIELQQQRTMPSSLRPQEDLARTPEKAAT